jgi:hypothetical protein
MIRRRFTITLSLVSLGLAAPALAVVPNSQSSAAPSDSAAPGRFCVERLPEGRTRPKVTENVPSKIPSGYAVELEVTVEHEAAETVMPGGTEFQLGSDDATALAKEGFVLPSPKGPSKMRIERVTKGTPANTKVTLPLLVLPKEPGRTTLTLPSLPITIARASGEVFTVCTSPHDLTVEDPTASTPDAKPKGNPPGRRQLEEWTAAKQAVQVGLIALVVGALLATLFLLWKRRPKRVPPPPPPRPPWDVAIEELAAIKRDDLVHQLRYAEHYDRVSDTVRKYLGARYGFDGLESTTKEMLNELHQAKLEVGTLSTVELFLHDADLVKFAKRTPTEAECVIVLDQAEGFVRSTLPTTPIVAPETTTESNVGGDA